MTDFGDGNPIDEYDPITCPHCNLKYERSEGPRGKIEDDGCPYCKGDPSFPKMECKGCKNQIRADANECPYCKMMTKKGKSEEREGCVVAIFKSLAFVFVAVLGIAGIGALLTLNPAGLLLIGLAWWILTLLMPD